MDSVVADLFDVVKYFWPSVDFAKTPRNDSDHSQILLFDLSLIVQRTHIQLWLHVNVGWFRVVLAPLVFFI